MAVSKSAELKTGLRLHNKFLEPLLHLFMATQRFSQFGRAPIQKTLNNLWNSHNVLYYGIVILMFAENLSICVNST